MFLQSMSILHNAEKKEYMMICNRVKSTENTVDRIITPLNADVLRG
jgi:hypothetical protein